MGNAGDFFNSQSVSAQKVETARFVQEGDSITVNVGFNLETDAEESGWYVPLPIGRVMTWKELEEHMIELSKVQQFPLPCASKKISAGKRYVAKSGGMLFQTSAETNGFLLKQPDGSNLLVSELHYQAVFGDQQPVGGQALIAIGDEVKAVVLSEETTFEFISGTYTAPAGYVLYENTEDEDGYTVVSPAYFFRDFIILK